MRTASAGLIASIAAEVTTLARLLEVTRNDGTVLYFTDHDKKVNFDSHEWRADLSFTSSSIFTSSTLANSQNVSVTMALASSGGVTEEDIRARRYKRAVARLIIVDRAHPEYGGLVVFKGVMGRIVLSDKHKVEIEIVPRGSGGFGAIAGEAYSMTCRAALFDARCGLNREDFKVTFTVTASLANTFNSDELDQADNNWTLGQLKWLTGLNAGTSAIVAASDQSSKSVTTVEPPLNPPQVGDTGEIFPGCSKMLSMCRDRYGNVANFRGEPYVPTSILYRQPTIQNVSLTPTAPKP